MKIPKKIDPILLDRYKHLQHEVQKVRLPSQQLKDELLTLSVNILNKLISDYENLIKQLKVSEENINAATIRKK
jgi:hypothetical protein